MGGDVKVVGEKEGVLGGEVNLMGFEKGLNFGGCEGMVDNVGRGGVEDL